MVKLIIDPGHGGKDPGGGTNADYKEKDFVLKISKYQYERFKELGVNVLLTRTTDVYIDSTPRANIVKNSKADYCISNHINAGGGDGAETIYSIHSTGKLAINILNELKSVGQKVRRAFTKQNKQGNDWYFMHRQTGAVDTTIVEYAFADTKEDSDRLLKNWKTYAEAVVKVFCEHVGVKYVAPGAIKPTKPVAPKPIENKPVNGYTGNSIVDYLKSIKVDSSIGNRRKLAAQYGIKGYTGSAAQNTLLLNAMRKGAAPTPVKPTPKPVSFKVGSKVKIKSSAKNYTRVNNVPIPTKYKNKSLTIQQVGKDDILIKELVSWVRKSDLV